jgi:hypothetical protein
MEKRFFFITSYDSLSGAIIASLLNCHPDIHCSDDIATQKKIDEIILEAEEHTEKFCCHVPCLSAHEFQNKILVERSRLPLRKANLLVSPKLRIHFLIRSWLDIHKNVEAALLHLTTCQHSAPFQLVLQHITATAESKEVDLGIPLNRLFVFALAKMITEDTLDSLVPGKKINLEKMIHDKNSLMEIIKGLTSPHLIMNGQYMTTLQQQLEELRRFISDVEARAWEPWQTQLLDTYLNLHLQALGFPHTSKPLAAFYHEQGYDQPLQTITYSKLLSIHLNSNRPTQLTLYLDSIEETIDDLNMVEVLVNIDDDDFAMEEMLQREMMQRPFTIKYLTSPRPASFCDLWAPINKLLSITDKDAYFLLNVSDEMLFATRGWDTLLKKYVGFFPDHIFRLRVSRNKLRNYFDRWECSFAQDAIPITTKKWIDIGGDWNPCFGPDSFQQLVAFYLAKEGQFSSSHYLRELPLLDIRFSGDIPSQGIEQEKAWRLDRDHIRAMQICQSYPMQLEARRRAMLLKANMMIHANLWTEAKIVDMASRKQLQIIDSANQTIYSKIDYHVNPVSIFFINQIRKFRFYAYFGAGKQYKRGLVGSMASYLAATSYRVYQVKCGVKKIVRSIKGNKTEYVK